jgi:hypothetical protein
MASLNESLPPTMVVPIGIKERTTKSEAKTMATESFLIASFGTETECHYNLI